MTTADDLRASAARHEQEREASFQRSDTDGFLSQWASGLSAARDRLQADIVEAGGLHRFPALFDLDGRYIPARVIEGQWGKRWMVLNDQGRSTGTFLPYHPVRRNTLARKGYVEGWVMRPAEAFTNGTGYGLSGRAWTDVRPTDKPTDPPAAILSVDRWADEESEVQS
jgi:hypothetical protein